MVLLRLVGTPVVCVGINNIIIYRIMAHYYNNIVMRLDRARARLVLTSISSKIIIIIIIIGGCGSAALHNKPNIIILYIMCITHYFYYVRTTLICI